MHYTVARTSALVEGGLPNPSSSIKNWQMDRLDIFNWSRGICQRDANDIIEHTHTHA